MSEAGRWKKSFDRNPVAWLLGGFLAFSVFSHYRTGSDFTRVCETVASLQTGYTDFESAQQFKASGIDLHSIILKAKQEEALLNANTPEGRAYRWWKQNTDYLRRTCGHRLSEPESSE